MDILTWANNNEGFVALLYTVATGGMMLLLIWSNWLTRRMIHNGTRPHISLKVRLDDDSLIRVYVNNNGPFGALDMQLVHIESKEKSVLATRDYFPPLDELKIALGTIRDFEHRTSQKELIILSYKSELNEKNKIKYTWRLDQLGGNNTHETR